MILQRSPLHVCGEEGNDFVSGGQPVGKTVIHEVPAADENDAHDVPGSWSVSGRRKKRAPL